MGDRGIGNIKVECVTESFRRRSRRVQVGREEGPLQNHLPSETLN